MEFYKALLAVNGIGVVLEGDKAALVLPSSLMPHAAYYLLMMYYKGQVVEQNNVTAYAWWNIAATNGEENAKNNKSIVTKKMTTAQIAKAEELVKEMVKKNPKLLNKK
tara:strand:+ start:117 stop:440 length:324 start_codon:yes stop_codon:yes gene_type:complete